MDCPVDGTTLLLSERHGVEIDYCPQCRGVWLDRGELDKILDRADREYDEPRPARDAYPPTPTPQRDHRDQAHGGQKRRKHKGFLGELFEFD